MTTPSPVGQGGDLVERLRMVARTRLHNPELAIEWQAADEIERLRRSPTVTHEGELLPCPMDSGEAEVFQSRQDGLWYVRCKTCSLKTGPQLINDGGEQKLVVIAAWNTRSLQAERLEVNAAAKELVAKLDECAPHIANAFMMEAMRGRPYSGPQYDEELEKLRAALNASMPTNRMRICYV